VIDRNSIDALLIAGPTASGKSALASALASRLDGEIINADSMQVYRDLRIITARPSAVEEQAAPHRLYGFVDAATNYSVGRWLAAVESAAAAAREAGRLPVFVGGTGLYFTALVRGLSDIPAVDAVVRARTRRDAEGVESSELHAHLASLDPATAAGLRPSDRQRILRALEVYAATGRALAAFQSARQSPLLAAGAWRGVFLAPDRTELRARIDRRFDAMMSAGALDEVRALGERRLDPDLPAMRAHGVPGLLAHLRGEISLDDAIVRGKADTRRYVKRQFTFARHQLPDFVHVDPGEAEAAILIALER
jgi:tRNA dimethylallyltransferase